jgi:hypothetical protein
LDRVGTLILTVWGILSILSVFIGNIELYYIADVCGFEAPGFCEGASFAGITRHIIKLDAIAAPGITNNRNRYL